MGREEIFIDLGGGAPKNADFLRKNDSNSEFYCLRRLRRPCWMACRPLTLSEAQGSLGGGPVGEYGLASQLRNIVANALVASRSSYKLFAQRC